MNTSNIDNPIKPRQWKQRKNPMRIKVHWEKKIAIGWEKKIAFSGLIILAD